MVSLHTHRQIRAVRGVDEDPPSLHVQEQHGLATLVSLESRQIVNDTFEAKSDAITLFDD